MKLNVCFILLGSFIRIFIINKRKRFNMNFKQLHESIKSIKKLASDNDLDISKFDNKELLRGMEVEREHDGGEGEDVDVVSNELDLLKIVLAHLREDPKYYSKLDKIGL
jgi:fructose-1,6-bisphosphatase